MVLFAGHGMQVTKEIVTLLEANKSSFAAVGLSYDGEDATFMVTAVDVDTTNLASSSGRALRQTTMCARQIAVKLLSVYLLRPTVGRDLDQTRPDETALGRGEPIK